MRVIDTIVYIWYIELTSHSRLVSLISTSLDHLLKDDVYIYNYTIDLEYKIKEL